MSTKRVLLSIGSVQQVIIQSIAKCNKEWPFEFHTQSITVNINLNIHLIFRFKKCNNLTTISRRLQTRAAFRISKTGQPTVTLSARISFNFSVPHRRRRISGFLFFPLEWGCLISYGGSSSQIKNTNILCFSTFRKKIF